MDTSQNSSFHSSQYAALLQTVTDLRTELVKTVDKNKSLEEQNQKLNANYFALKTECEDINKRLAETKERYITVVQEKIERDKTHESLIQHLKRQIAEKAKEFDSIREKLIPQDIDALRLKVQEELSLRHKQDLKRMEEEIVSWREKYYEAQRERDTMKMEMAHAYNLLQMEQKALLIEKEECLDGWRVKALSTVQNELSFVDGNLSNTSHSPSTVPLGSSDKLRAQTSKVHELSHVCEQLRQEVLSVRKERDQLVFDHQSSRAHMEHLIVQLKAEAVQRDEERVQQQERLILLQTECERKESIARNAKTAAEDAYRLKDLADKARDDADRFAEQVRRDCDSEVQQLREDHVQEVLMLREMLTSTQSKVLEREELLRRMTRESNETQLRMENSEGELRRIHLQAMNELKKTYHFAHVENIDLQTSLRHLQEQMDESARQLVMERDTLVSEVSRIRREKDVLHAKSREQEAAAENSRKQSVQQQQSIIADLHRVEKQLREMEAQKVSVEIKLDSMIGKIAEVDKQRVLVDQQRVVAQGKIDSLQQRLQVLKDEVRNKLLAMKEKCKQEMVKERKKTDFYKQKAELAHDQLRKLATMGDEED